MTSNRDEFGDKIILPDDPDFNVSPITIEITPHDLNLAIQIGKRYKHLVETNGGPMIDAQIAAMDVAIVHCNGCPMNLEALYSAPGQALYDDVRGIDLHIHRRTGKLRGFTPKYALSNTPRH